MRSPLQENRELPQSVQLEPAICNMKQSSSSKEQISARHEVHLTDPPERMRPELIADFIGASTRAGYRIKWILSCPSNCRKQVSCRNGIARFFRQQDSGFWINHTSTFVRLRRRMDEVQLQGNRSTSRPGLRCVDRQQCIVKRDTVRMVQKFRIALDRRTRSTNFLYALRLQQPLATSIPSSSVSAFLPASPWRRSTHMSIP